MYRYMKILVAVTLLFGSDRFIKKLTVNSDALEKTLLMWATSKHVLLLSLFPVYLSCVFHL